MGGEHHDLVTVAPLGQLLRDRRAHPVRRICGHSSVTGRHYRGRQVSQPALTGSVLRAGGCPLIKHQHATGWEGGPRAAVRLSIRAAVRLSIRAAHSARLTARVRARQRLHQRFSHRAGQAGWSGGLVRRAGLRGL